MLILAIDCAASLCAACVYDADSDNELGRSVIDLGKGHAEHLVGVVNDAMAASGVQFADLGAIAVSVGPGSFTGLRVAVSAARGYALALGIPAIGITTLEALAFEAHRQFAGRKVLAALSSARDDIQAAVYDEFAMILYAPAVMSREHAAKLAIEHGAVLAGTAAAAIAEVLHGHPAEIGPTGATADISAYARIAAARGPGGARPTPLYLREPDAKPQAGFILARSEAP